MMIDFTLTLQPATVASDYSVSLYDVRSNRPLASATLRLPDYTQLEQEHLGSLHAFITTPMPAERLEALGKEMARLLFPPVVHRALLAELAQRADRFAPIRLRLHIESPELERLPWEFAHLDASPVSTGFLGLSSQFHLVRQVTRTPLPRLPLVAEPLRVLVAWADPRSAIYSALPHLQTEVTSVLATLRQRAAQHIVVEELKYVTPGGLQRHLTERPPHILHIIGHGDIKPTGGILVFHGDQMNSATNVYGEDLANWLSKDTVRLVVLSACRTASPHYGIASVLAKAGLPAVVAMQLPLRDAAAELFAGAFYSALVEARPVEEALQRARKSVSHLGPDWGVPVLYLSGESGELFHIPPRPVIPGLPRPATRFFGRGEELNQLTEMVRSGAHRLVTLTGIGGAGKTRLAIEAVGRLARTFGENLWFVPLAHITDPTQILDVLVELLRLGRADNKTLWELVRERLEKQPSLLVFDNLEQLIAGGAEIIWDLLDCIPTLTCLVTSRQKLNLVGEAEFPVIPLPTPDTQGTMEQILEFPSVELFQDRSHIVRPDFQITPQNMQAVAAICRTLEGIPLALELAAARAHLVTPAQMLRQLEQRLDFLTTRQPDQEERHRTLRAAIDWSYRLLSPTLKRFFLRCSVFRAGWTLEAAEAICKEPHALDLLEQLRECSLIQTKDRNSEIYFTMLETIREYAWEKLSARERIALSRRHAEYFLRLAEQAEPELSLKEQGRLQYRIEAEMDNMRAALAWCQTPKGDPDLGLRLAGALSGFWYMRGFLHEGWEHLAGALSKAKSSTQSEVRAKTLRRAARLAWFQGDYASVRTFHEQGLALYRQLQNTTETAVTLYHLGLVVAHQGEDAELYFKEAAQLLQTQAEPRAHAHVLCCIGEMAWFQGDYALGHAIQTQSLQLARQIGSRRDIAYSLANLANIAAIQGEYPQAHTYLDEALALLQELGERWGYGYVLWSMGNLARLEGAYAHARILGSDAVQIAWELKNEWGIAFALESLAYLAVHEEDAERSAVLLGAATALRKSIGSPLPAFTQADYQRCLLAARTALGQQAFERAWATGASLALDEAIAIAASHRR